MIAKKDKNKVKDISHIICYSYKKKVIMPINISKSQKINVKLNNLYVDN